MTAQRGMLSRNPTFSMMVTISAGMVILEIVDSPVLSYPLDNKNIFNDLVLVQIVLC